MHSAQSSVAQNLTLTRRLGLSGIVSSQYFELRLGSVSDQVDYLAAISRSNARALYQQLVASRCHLGGSERKVRSLLRVTEGWADGKSTLSTCVPTLWLEFDRFLHAPLLPVPSLSLCLIPGYQPDRTSVSFRSERAIAIVHELLQLVDLGTPQPLAALDACFRCLPSGGSIIHCSVMLGRDPCALKLYVAIPRSQLHTYLRAIEWAGDHDALRSALEGPYSDELTGSEVFIDLNLTTLTDASSCGLGLALSQQHVIRDGGDRKRSRELDVWRNSGLCTVEDSRRLQSWLQRMPLQPAHSDTRSDRFLDLKLVWEAKSGFHGKAYLGLHPRVSRARIEH